MRLGMMQPYFFPYLGYFALIAATDQWVVFDTAQYIRRGWVNRNRVLTSGSAAWKYVRVPVRKAPQTTPICEVQLADPGSVRDQIISSLDEYRCWQAPYYQETTRLLQHCTDLSSDDLNTFLIQCLQITCDHLSLPFRPLKYSDLRITMPAHVQPGDWALQTAIHLNAAEYINPPGGLDLFDPAAFEHAGIQLSILDHRLPTYSQRQPEFISGLSIIDALVWTGRDATRRMIDDYQLSVISTRAAA